MFSGFTAAATRRMVVQEMNGRRGKQVACQGKYDRESPEIDHVPFHARRRGRSPSITRNSRPNAKRESGRIRKNSKNFASCSSERIARPQAKRHEERRNFVLVLSVGLADQPRKPPIL